MSLIDSALEKINEAWKNASEEMYKAQAESSSQPSGETNKTKNRGNKEKEEKGGDDVQDVDFEEVKD